ncbi:imidazolonepropionase-like domain-containing protein [Wenjunlia tyrosinilytica]|uniref:Aminodeoxyfutalosine deaminase/Imidazolonepropionase-like composite domain-containing protein n=1 Tax=Wenjunlia tyrosinilytica TaxID=1544741 RepID=A0A918DYZ0_9ACTN|nr:hypothetical protein [Wenjunlia tyrosinilytica]GGO89815.1 hypothetical protein GCM10012280_33930 [Wenjunlia tyrosinilytica]
MLTLHTAPVVRPTGDGEPVRDGAVLVDGELIAAVGALDELEEAYPRARVRRWPGVLVPGLVHAGPLAGDDPRGSVHQLLKAGVTAVAEPGGDPAVLEALSRSGLARGGGPRALVPGARADLAVFDGQGTCVATVLAGRLVHRRA